MVEEVKAALLQKAEGGYSGVTWQGSSWTLTEDVLPEEAEAGFPGEGVGVAADLPPTVFVEEWATAIFIVGIVGVLLAALGMARAMWRNKQALWQLLHCAGEQAPLCEVLQEKLLEVKVGQLRALLQLCCYGLVPFSVTAPFWFYAWDLDMAALVCLTQPLLAAFALFPRLVSPRSFDAVCCVVAALAALFSAPWRSHGLQLLMLGPANGLMMALVSVRRTMPRRLPVLLLMNLAFGLTSSSTIMLRGTFILKGFRPYLAAGQLLLVLLMTAAAPLLERRGRLWIFELLERKELQEAFAASQCLLRSCFDVVVELRSDGCIVSEGPELGALLLRESGRQCMRGASFLELLEEEECREFQRRLAGSAARDLGLAESMQLSIRDACENLLRLEVMWYEHRRGDRAKHYMLGLREAPEQPQPRLREVSRAVEVALEDNGVPETCSVSSASSVLDTDALLELDLTAQVWRVRQTSSTFRARLGRLRRGTPFLAKVAQPESFRSWLMQALQARGAGEGGRRFPQDFRLRLKMPQGTMRALCRLADSDGEAQTDMARVALLFHSVRAEGLRQEQPPPQRHLGTSPRSATLSLGKSEEDESGAELGGPAMLLLDTGAEGLTVLHVSPGFRAAVGPLQCGSSFLAIVGRRASFRCWLSRVLRNEDDVPRECQLTLRMPQGRVRVFCSLAEAAMASDSVGLLFRSAEGGSTAAHRTLHPHRCSL